MDKESLRNELIQLLDHKVSDLERMLNSMQESRDSANKSTAGDKHEVGRAMMQAEMDTLNAQLVRKKEELSTLTNLPLKLSNESIRKGHLVQTDKGSYYLAIGLGAVNIEERSFFAISVDSPIGQALLGHSVGDEVTFNGRSIRIVKID